MFDIDEALKSNEIYKIMIYNSTRMWYFTCLSLIFDIENLKAITTGDVKTLLSDDSFVIEMENNINKMELLLEPKSDYSWEIFCRDLSYCLSNNNPEKLTGTDYLDPKNDIVRNYRGIELSWLMNYFKLGGFMVKYPQLSDLPLHGKIISTTEPIGITTETMILSSAIDFYNKAKIYLNKYESLTRQELIINLPKDVYFVVNKLANLINTYSIQSFINFMTFIECFVNSVAYNYIQTNEIKDEILKKYLSDDVERKLISSPQKLYFYPIIIKKGDLKKLNIYNAIKKEDFSNHPDQEIYKKYFDLIELRNSYIHYSENPNIMRKKSPILLNHFDWFENAEKAYRVCLKIASNFWKDCGYENGPKYLINLDEIEFEKTSKDSFISEVHVISSILGDYKEESPSC